MKVTQGGDSSYEEVMYELKSKCNYKVVRGILDSRKLLEFWSLFIDQVFKM